MRVVVLSQSATEREAISRTLRRASFEVQVAGDAKSAATAVQRDAPDVVLLSWPPSGGLELVRLLRGADATKHAHLVALLDASSGGREIQPALAAGVNEVLIRPFVDAELVGRLQAPARLAKWFPSTGSKPTTESPSSFERLAVWKRLGEVVAEDLAQLVGQTVRATPGWPEKFGRDVRCATIPLSLARDGIEVLVSVAADPWALGWIGSTLLGNPGANEAALSDALRELASTAGGAVKRVAMAENVTLTTGLPVNATSVRSSGERVAAFMLPFEDGRATVAGHVLRAHPAVRAPELSEGMVVVNDVRSESGALLVTAGSRLTRTTAERLARMLGPKVLIEVATTG